MESKLGASNLAVFTTSSFTPTIFVGIYSILLPKSSINRNVADKGGLCYNRKVSVVHCDLCVVGLKHRNSVSAFGHKAVDPSRSCSGVSLVCLAATSLIC